MKGSLLSDFLAGSEAIGEDLVFDAPAFHVRNGIEKVSLIAVIENGELTEDFKDTVIALKSAEAEVVLLVPSTPEIDPHKLFSIIVPMQVEVKLLPPTNANDMNAYWSRVERFSSIFPNVPTYSKAFFPVTDGLLGLAVQKMTKAQAPDFIEGSLGNDVFFQSEKLDLFDAVRKGFISTWDSVEAFEEYIDLHVAALYEKWRRDVEHYATKSQSQS